MAKYDLTFDPPLMNAAGFSGFAPDLHAEIDWSKMGAFITNPISLAPRTPAHGRRFASFPGGFLLHTGYPNPGINRALRRYTREWNSSPIPVIVHLLSVSSSEVAQMARRLEFVEGVVGLEISLASDASEQHVIGHTRAAIGELPVIIRLPMERSLELAPAAIHAGANAISLAPPRGVFPTENGEMIHGRLYGPSILPIALRIVRELAGQGMQVIGAGGVYTQAQADAMLQVGAIGVQVDSVLWRGAGRWLFT
jgi:dihydroorotate dehydrogenase (NAD+) catalytic subunit